MEVETVEKIMNSEFSKLDQLYVKLGKSFQDESVVFLEGSEGDEMYIILEGFVEILKTYKKFEKVGNKKILCGYESQRLTLLKAGDFFGEMAILNSQKRSATAMARGTVRLLAINRENFLTYVAKNTEMVFTMLKVLSSRIRETDCYPRADYCEASVSTMEVISENQKAHCDICSRQVPYVVKCPECEAVLSSNPHFICWICGSDVKFDKID